MSVRSCRWGPLGIVAVVLLVVGSVAACSGGSSTPSQTTFPYSSVTTIAGISGEGPLPTAEIGPELLTGTQPVDIIVRPGTADAYLVGQLGTLQPIAGLDTQEPVLGAPVLDISDDIVANFEEGLLGATFSPDGTHLYLHVVSARLGTVDEYAIAPDGTIDATSKRVVYSLTQPAEAHNGGSVLFGPDGYLYIFLGDGGLFDEPREVAQNLSSPLGKILRIDPTPSSTATFTVPSDNPFVGVADALPEIWSYGVRNPWRASFDADTGDLWFGDVGEYFYEEVDVALAADGGGSGISFGWPALEGPAANDKRFSTEGHQAPFFSYVHGDMGCSVSGGQVYRGSINDDLVGWYVFGDYCSGRVWALETNADGESGRIAELGVVPNVVSVAADAAGELYAISVMGPVHRIELPAED